ncbi:MAG: UDP-N-acetylglucosamine--N-acetylmuramyl-(pentapeptide) pyrophosphoryl-undecaprenol N-acetylglucosamine transferase, partial [Candidatus Paceibacterales bacterium]
MRRFLIACGGTGGHLAPGIALAEELIARGYECKLLISRKQVDSRLIQQYPKLDYTKIPGVGFSLKPMKLLKFLFEQTQAFWISVQLLRKQKPTAVISFGGFTSLGIVAAAVLKRIPVVLHEANRVPGKATTLFSSVAKRVYLPVEVKLNQKAGERVQYMGFPLRKSIQRMDKKDACASLGLDANKKRLLVLGGSQGSSALNEWVLNHFEKLGALGVDVYCVTGLGKVTEKKIEYRDESGNKAEAIFTDFIDNVSE